MDGLNVTLMLGRNPDGTGEPERLRIDGPVPRPGDSIVVERGTSLILGTVEWVTWHYGDDNYVVVAVTRTV